MAPQCQGSDQGNSNSMSSPEPGNDHGHGQAMSDWLRSRRPGNGDKVGSLLIGFADRHHPLTSVEAVQVQRPNTVEMRGRALTGSTVFNAFGQRR